jgi:hypothetical protein
LQIVMMGQSCGALKLPYDRIKRTVSVLWRAEIAQACVHRRSKWVAVSRDLPMPASPESRTICPSPAHGLLVSHPALGRDFAHSQRCGPPVVYAQGTVTLMPISGKYALHSLCGPAGGVGCACLEDGPGAWGCPSGTLAGTEGKAGRGCVGIGDAAGGGLRCCLTKRNLCSRSASTRTI